MNRKPLEEFAEAEQTELVRAELDRTKKELAIARKVIRTTLDDNEKLELLAEFSSRKLKPPKWLKPPKKSAKHKGIVCSILSDSHFDEVVNPAEINFINAYSREIAEQRLRRYAERVISITRDYLTGVEIEGAVIFLGGDLVSGVIHDMSETNEDTAAGTAIYWADQLAACLKTIADEFGSVHVPCVVGNHGRMTMKPRTKLRARDNWDWVIYQQLARHFSADPRVSFDITDGTDVSTKIYNTTFLLSHGDQVSGGGGIGGIWPPVMRMLARKKQREQFDCLVIGHFHQLIMAPAQGLIVNGSSKGYDEFASVCNFGPEVPQQALWITTPEHGVTFSGPVFVADRKEEGW